MPFCIPAVINRKLKKAINDGELNVDSLMKMTSEELSTKLEKYVGKEYSNEISNRFVRNFNTELSEEEVGYIMKVFAKIDDLKMREGYNQNGSTAWSRMYAELDNYMGGVVNPNNKLKISEQIKETLKSEAQKIKDQDDIFNKIIQGGKSGFNILTSPIYKSIKASLDASFALRQGFKIFTKSPKTWYESAGKAYDIFKNVGNKDIMDGIMTEFKARLIAHPNYERLVNEGKLAVNVVEDWFPTTVAEKIPKLGNVFKASNDAFSVFSQGARFDIANDLLTKYQSQVGRELTKNELKAISTVANSVTGRGSLGKAESISGALNKLFFSARYISSQADTFILPFTLKDKFAQQEALKHSLTTLSTVAGLMGVASMFGDVETDPRSSKFGKLKINDNNYIDLTAGLGSYITLAARQATGETKSSSGKVTKLNTGDYGSRTRSDVAIDWLTGKLAPAPGTLYNVLGKGEMYGGEKPTTENIARNLIAPISADNIYDYMQNEDMATALLLSVSDLLGAGVTSYKK